VDQDKKKYFDWLTYNVLVKLAVAIFLAALIILLVVWLVYAYHFASSKISGDPAAWGQLGDFIGGVTNPLLGFLTLVILSLTIILQSRQLSISATELELSRKELELTRKELRRSAQAQEQSEKALRVQAEAADRSARLSAINFLLEHYESVIKSLEEGMRRLNNRLGKDPENTLKKMRTLDSKIDELNNRKSTLINMLDDLFNEISEKPSDA
jgi:cbb3-type cytochrome oxidase subunit 3